MILFVGWANVSLVRPMNRGTPMKHRDAFAATVATSLLALVLIAPAFAPAADAKADRGAPLFHDLGSYHRAVTTKSEDAQKYFDQGLTLLYAFNHAEAVRSFTEAARLDPTCAMA